jgi:hypothetical protein
VNSDIQTLLPGYVLNDFQTDFWLRFCTAFPNLLVEATVDSFYLRFDVRSPEQTDSESGIAVLVSKWGDEEIIVAFGGHVNTRYFSYHPTADVIIEDALEVVREIIAGELVGVVHRLGGGRMCYACELDKYISEGDQIYSWNKG